MGCCPVFFSGRDRYFFKGVSMRRFGKRGFLQMFRQAGLALSGLVWLAGSVLAQPDTPSAQMNEGMGTPADLYYLDEAAGSAERPDWMREAFPSEDPKAIPGEYSSPRQTQRPLEDASGPINLEVTKPLTDERESFREFTEQLREEQAQKPFVAAGHCEPGERPDHRKRVAVAGFSMQHPEQGLLGALSDAGEETSAWLYNALRETDRFETFAAPQYRAYASLESAPSHLQENNRLVRYSAVSREMGVQFIVSGVIRDISVNHEGSWDTSYQRRLKTALFAEDTGRVFRVDMVIHDGFTGQVLFEKRYQTSGRWEAGRTERVGFGSVKFWQMDYGQAVRQQISAMAEDVVSAVACQPMLVPVRDVRGKSLVLDVGSGSGLRPGDRLALLRAKTDLSRPSERPELWETGVEATLESLALDRSLATMPEEGGINNIQAGDYAVVR